ncbi:TPA: YadA-like family protein, partial [Escherichia coli]
DGRLVQASAAGEFALAVGTGASAAGEFALAVGNGAKATEKASTAVGSWAAADGKQSTALGVGAYAYADASTAAGTAAYVDGSAIYGTAIGNYAKVDKNATEGVALGAKAISAHKNSVALGANSRTTRDNEVYIGYEEASGKAYKTRTLGGLTDGTRPSDAATVRQVDRVKDSVEQLAQDTNTRLVVEAKKSREYTDSRTTVGVNPDGKLTRAEGATKTIAVNDGLVALSGRTDRIDYAVGSVDRRVTKNTQAIQSNTRQLQEHNARLNSQQRQIRENHEEMKRAAAQSAALAGLFQPYSVGKFNATAALGGYSDKQAVAVGVGYRFNEQTAAKAGIAASDGDVSYNMGVNFEF